MLVVEIAAGGVSRVRIRGSEAEQSRDLARWPIIRGELTRLNRRLEREALADVQREVMPPDGGSSRAEG
jgi:hypothetical protein